MLQRVLGFLIALPFLLVLLQGVLAQDGAADGTDGTAVPEAENTNATAAEGPTMPVLAPWLDPYKDALPQTLGDQGALFALSLAAWIVIAFLVIVVVAPLLKWITVRTPTNLDHHIVGIVSKPGFAMVFTFGIVDSLRVWSLPAWLRATLENAWTVVLIIGLTWIIYRLWHEIILDVGDRLSKKTETELDDKLIPLFNKVGGVIILIGGIWTLIASFGVNMTFFAAGGAIGGLVIAFAAQDTLSNLFSGVFILLDQPFREGDRIEIKEESTWGDVVEIGLRTTRIRTRDNRMVIVPNNVIGTNPVINHSYPDSTYRFETHVGVAYGSDIERARRAMSDAVQEVDGILHDHGIDVLFIEFADSALLFRIRWWMASYLDLRRIQDEVHTRIDAKLREAGVEIPFPQRDVWFKGAASPAAPGSGPEGAKGTQGAGGAGPAAPGIAPA